jgi:flagella basal body P-ring formation protein FlgA
MTRYLPALVLTALLHTVTAAAGILPGGQPLTADMAEALVARHLPEGSADRRWDIQLTTPGFPLPNRARGDASMEIEELRLDPQTSRFEASLRVTLAGGETGRIALQGRAEEQVEVPVLARPVPRGHRIDEDDLAAAWLPAGRVENDALVDPEALIGQEAGRRLVPGRILRAADLRAPRLVRKDEPVTLVYRRGSLDLVTAGLSLDAGALGDVVRVENPSSKRPLRGVVIGPRQVQVGGSVEDRS